MMSLGQIQEMAREQAVSAAKSKKRPLVIEAEDDAARMLRSIPNLGSYIPEGWEETTRYFVDSSGFGDTADLAAHGCLSLNQLVEKVVPGRGYAIVQEGQFQVYVGEFKKVVVH